MEGRVSNDCSRSVSTVIGGRLKFFLQYWETLTTDSSILENIVGAKIDFKSEIQQSYVPKQISCSSDVKTKIDAIIVKFISSSIIEEVDHCLDEHIGHIFPVTKKNGDLRIILNLKPLNEHVAYEHFKMEHLNTAVGLMEQNCFMASIDLKDAYYSISIHEDFRKFLRFYWNGKLYQFTCLAQGLSCAPRLFTKIMKPVFGKLRSEGLLSVYYLDDSLLLGQNLSSCLNNVHATTRVLEKAGFIINKAKSVFVPAKEIVFLGFCLNSVNMTVSLPTDKKLRIIEMCTMFASGVNFVIREVARFIGVLVSSLPAVQYGKLFYRFLEKCKIDALHNGKGNFDNCMVINAEARSEIEWWSRNIINSFCPIKIAPPSLTITTDASQLGWGGIYGNMKANGRWSHDEMGTHINVLELKAILFSLKSLLIDVKGCHIRVLTDSSTAVSYINNMGGVKSMKCHRITREIWLWAIDKHNHLSAEHLPGTENVQADRASRVFDDNTEWEIPSKIFDKLVHSFGEFDIDLFASRLNAKCNVYCSWKPDPNASFIDAFSHGWNGFSLPYIFPPFSIIMRCLQKICQDHAQAVFVAPLWPTQPWFPKMMRMLVDTPVILPLGILSLPFKSQVNHKLHKNLRLIVCRLSGNYMESETFRGKLLTSSVLHGELPQSLNMKFILENGFVSVINDKLIPCSIMR